MNVIDLLQREQQKSQVPVLRPGDTVRVHVKVVEGTRERIQVFEGLVIALHGKSGAAASFTVRRVAHGVGVERTFLLHSPRIERIDVLRHGQVRRAKLFYLREKVGKHARIRERRTPLGGSETVISRDEPAVETAAPEDGGEPVASEDASPAADNDSDGAAPDEAADDGEQ